MFLLKYNDNRYAYVAGLKGHVRTSALTFKGV